MKDFDSTPATPPAPEPRHIAMKKLGEAATRIFMTLTDGLHAGDAKRIDNAPGTFMAVSVDHLGGSRRASVYAVAHRHEVNGDLVPDPDVEFYVSDDPSLPGTRAVYPTAIDHGPLGYHRHVDLDASGTPVRVASRGQATLASFCDDWMKAIAVQQRLVNS
jgi:hypothetical protein